MERVVSPGRYSNMLAKLKSSSFVDVSVRASRLLDAKAEIQAVLHEHSSWVPTVHDSSRGAWGMGFSLSSLTSSANLVDVIHGLRL